MTDTPSAPGKESAPPLASANEPKLESWGEVAAYLRRDIRTVQRWEKEQGLPVRRLVIGKQGQVYAYRSELDRWIQERQPKAEAQETATDPQTLQTTTTTFSLDDHAIDDHRYFTFSRLSYVALAVLPILSIVGYYLVSHSQRDGTPPDPPARKLLFVRPFANLSGASTDKEFVDGLTDEMITQLGRVDPAFIGVFAPTTSKELAPKTIQELKRMLKADFVLEGSVRRADEQVRIDMNLISTTDQTPAWSNSYTGDLREALSFQDSVAKDVASHLTIALPHSTDKTPGIVLPSKSRGPTDPEVYEAYLSGRLYLLDRDFPRSMAAFQRALQKDPHYAPALAGLASSVLLLGEAPNDAIAPSEAMPKAREAARKALEFDPNLSDAYCVLANVAQGFDHDLREAERLYKKAIELDPNNVTALKWYGDYLSITNRLQEADHQIDLALELDPVSPLLNTAKAEVLYYQRNFDASLKQAQHTLDTHPEFVLARFWLASAYRQKKMFPQAIDQFDELRKHYPGNAAMLMAYGHALGLSGDKAGATKVLGELQSMAQSHYVPAVYVAGAYVGLGDLDHAFYWLDEAYKQKSDRLVYLGVDPIADPLRSDPRFTVLMKKVGLQ